MDMAALLARTSFSTRSSLSKARVGESPECSHTTAHGSNSLNNSPPSLPSHSDVHPKLKFLSKKRPASDGPLSSSVDSSSVSNQRSRRVKKPRVLELRSTPSHFTRKPNTGALGLTGAGIKLSEIPHIARSINKLDSTDPIIILLHRFLFNSQGQANKRKTNIRAFSGFVFHSEIDRVRACEKLLRVHYNLIRRLARFLCIPVPHAVRNTISARTSKPTRPTPHPEVKLSERADPGVHTLNVMTATKSTVTCQPVADAGDNLPVLRGDDGHCNSSAYTSTVVAKAKSDCPSSSTPIPLFDKGGDVHESYSAALRDEQLSMKKAVGDAIICFLESPRILKGQDKPISQDKNHPSHVAAAESEQVKKTRRSSHKQRKIARKAIGFVQPSKSCSDGDEDLETEALPWIELASK